MRRRRRAFAVVVSLFVSASAGVAQASTVAVLDVNGLISESDVVVRARVERVAARWADDGSRIVTDIEVSVLERMKGTAGESIVVMQPGGEVGELGQKVEGAPRFEVGEEVVLFLEARGPRFVVTGFSQGKFEVAGGWVRQARSEVHLIDSFTGAVVNPPAEAMTLGELKRIVLGTVSDVPSPIITIH